MRLTITEQILLTAIWGLKDEAYGVKIMERVHEYIKKDIAFGTLYNNLDQLIKKGYAESFKGEPLAVRGGKRKVFYKITNKGIQSLQEARELQKKLRQDLPDYAFDRSK